MAKLLHWRHRRRLKPFAEAYYSMFDALWDMPIEELKKLLVACDEATACRGVGWTTHAAAQAIRGDVERHIKQRSDTGAGSAGQ